MGRVCPWLGCAGFALCFGLVACERPSTVFEPGRPLLRAVAAKDRGLAVTTDAVSSRDSAGRWHRVFRLRAGQAVELAPDANHFGVYAEHGLVVHARDGTRLARFDALPLGYRHRLIGEGLVLSPIVEQTGVEDGRVMGVQVRSVSGVPRARIDAEGLRFTRASEGALTVATADAVGRYASDGRHRWTLALRAHDLAVARGADRVAVIDAEDTRRLIHLAAGAVIGVAEFRSPLWNAALSSDGRFSAATTHNRLHLFDEGQLRHSIALSAAHAVSLAVDDDGRVLVGAQDGEHRGLVFCYDRRGELLRSLALPVDDHAFRPAVSFLPDGRYLVRTRDALHEGACEPGGAP